MNSQILIIDDNKQFCISLSKNLSDNSFNVFTANNSAEAFDILEQGTIDVILLDVRLGDESGIEVLVRCSELYSAIPVIMLTGFASIESAVSSMKLGAFDYIQKPVKLEKLLTLINHARSLASLKRENQNLHERINDLSPHIISNDPRIKELLATMKKLATTNIPILLIGENGTGKELFADYVNSHAKREAAKMVKINCAAFPDSLLDNELFGHEKGAFTGATDCYKGVFEKADKGILFLDEIADMSLNVQAKVLRVLQNRELFRLGGNSVINVDIHYIAATNKSLEDLIKKGKFRKDLFYRLNAATIIIPPLRERKDDIPLLIDNFLDEYYVEYKKRISGVSERVLKLFYQYNWPGNIRELKNVINYAAALCFNDLIDLEDLPGKLLDSNYSLDSKNLLEVSEKNVLIKELKRCNYNKKKVAELLNISRSTLYSKLKKYEITI